MSKNYIWFAIGILAIMSMHSAYAESATVLDTIREGETRTYTVGGQQYEVTLVYVSDPGVALNTKFSINGELSEPLSEGESDELSSAHIKVMNILTNNRDGTASFELTAQTAVQDTMREGEIRTYTVGGQQYEVTLVYVSDPGVALNTKFSINGELSEPLSEGESDELSSAHITVTRILTNNRDGTASFELTAQTQKQGHVLTVGSMRAFGSYNSVYDVSLESISPPYMNDDRYSANLKIDGTEQKVYQGKNTVGNLEITVYSIDYDAASVRIDINNLPTEQSTVSSKYIIVVGKTGPATDVLTAIDTTEFMQQQMPAAAGTTLLDEQFQREFTSVPDDRVIILLRGEEATIILGTQISGQQSIDARNIAGFLEQKGLAVKTISSDAASMGLFDPGYNYNVVPSGEHIFFSFHPEGDRRPVSATLKEGETQPFNSYRREHSVSVSTISVRADGKSFATVTVNGETAEVLQGSETEIGGGIFTATRISTDDEPSGQSDVDTEGQSSQTDTQDEQPPANRCDSGCTSGDRCLPIGTRIANGGASYCSIDGSMAAQLIDGSACQNSYECVSNQCLNAVCVSLEKEVRETQGMLSGFISWISRIFG